MVVIDVPVLEALLMDERLDHREHEIAHEERDPDLETAFTDEGVRLGQEIGDGRRDQHPGCEGHERVEPVVEPEGGHPAQECREEREQGGERHQASAAWHDPQSPNSSSRWVSIRNPLDRSMSPTASLRPASSTSAVRPQREQTT